MTAENFPRPLKFYAVGLTLATVALGAFLISRAELPRGNQLGLALVLCALVTVTAHWRVKIVSSNYDMTLDFGPVIAALILFDPGVAMAIAFVGTLASEALRSRRPSGVLINTIDLTFATGCGGLVLAAGGGADPARILGEPGHLLLVLAAAMTMFVVDELDITTQAALKSGRSWLSELDLGWIFVLSNGLEVVLGLAIALLAINFPWWAMIVLAAPAYGLYVLMRRQGRSRRRAQEQLVRTEARLAEAQRIAHVGSWEWGADDDTMMWSDETYRILGFGPQGYLPTRQNYLERTHPEDRKRAWVALEEALETGEPFSVEHRVTRPDGSERFVHVRGEVERRDGNLPARLVGTLIDITDRKRLEDDLRRSNEALEHRAHHDALTGLPNRALLTDRLQRALSRTRRHGGQVALLMLDLDDFKSVNDSLGHEAGDVLLCEIGRRLQACVRPHDTVARLGGDEFVMLVEEADERRAAEVAGRAIEAVGVPLVISGRRVRVGVSVGVVLGHGDNPDGLLRAADMAMYDVKRDARIRHKFYASPDASQAT